jgi:hypothetical protein
MPVIAPPKGFMKGAVGGKGARKSTTLQAEKAESLVAIWGSNSAKVKQPSRGVAPGGGAEQAGGDAASASGDSDSYQDSEIDALMQDNSGKRGKKPGAMPTPAEIRRKRRQGQFRLHMFVGPQTSKNDVRRVFEQYEPQVEIRTTQKGNILNKTFFAVLTFRNKAMGLHAVKTFDGTDQREHLGVKPLKLALMLSREDQKKVRARAKHERAKRPKSTVSA